MSLKSYVRRYHWHADFCRNVIVALWDRCEEQMPVLPKKRTGDVRKNNTSFISQEDVDQEASRDILREISYATWSNLSIPSIRRSSIRTQKTVMWNMRRSRSFSHLTYLKLSPENKVDACGSHSRRRQSKQKEKAARKLAFPPPVIMYGISVLLKPGIDVM